MTPEQEDQALAALLDGTLPDEERFALLEAAASDARLGERLVALLALEPALSDWALDGQRGEAFVRRVQQRARSSGDSERFAQAVSAKFENRAKRPARKSSRRLNRPSRRLFWPGLAAAAVLLVATFFLVRKTGVQPSLPTESIARILTIDGEPQIRTRDGLRPAHAGDSIHIGDGLVSGSSSSHVVFEFTDGTRVDVAGDSEVGELDGGSAEASAGKRVKLVRGSVEARVAKQPAGKPLIFATPHATAEVLGTQLKIQIADGATRLDVSEGRVRLKRSSDGATVEVGAGEFSQASPDGTSQLVAMTAGEASPAKPSADGQAINLIPLIQPARDTIAGEWAIRNGELVSGVEQFGRIEIPFEPPDEYDLHLVFTRKDRNGDVAAILSHRGRSFLWDVGAYENTHCGFERIGGKSLIDNQTRSLRKAWLKNGRRYSALIKVRRDGVEAFLDGERVSQHRTNYKDFANLFEWKMRRPTVLGLGAFHTTVFHSVELIDRTPR